MNEQSSMFDLGDSAGDELARTSADGATWTEPSLFQQGRPAIGAELASDAAAAELAETHRATLAANAEHRVDIWQPARTNYYLAGCPCGWQRQLFELEQAQRFGRAHELDSASTRAELEAVRARHRAERRAAHGCHFCAAEPCAIPDCHRG